MLKPSFRGIPYISINIYWLLRHSEHLSLIGGPIHSSPPTDATLPHLPDEFFFRCYTSSAPPGVLLLLGGRGLLNPVSRIRVVGHDRWRQPRLVATMPRDGFCRWVSWDPRARRPILCNQVCFDVMPQKEINRYLSRRACSLQPPLKTRGTCTNLPPHHFSNRGTAASTRIW